MATVKEYLEAAEKAEARGNAADAALFRKMADRLAGSTQEAEAEPSPKAKPRATVSGAVRTLAQGITLGFGDEAEAYVRATFSARRS